MKKKFFILLICLVATMSVVTVCYEMQWQKNQAVELVQPAAHKERVTEGGNGL